MHIPIERLPVLAASFTLLWCCAAAAQPQTQHLPEAAVTGAPPIGLRAAIRLALEQPGLRAAGHEVAASVADIQQAGRLPNPELAYLREEEPDGSRTVTVQLNQAIELGGKRRARVALAERNAEAARVAWSARRHAIRAAVSAEYYAVLVAQERVAVADALAGLARQAVAVAGRRVAAGKISPVDETRARLASSEAATDLRQAQAELALARTRLGALLGRPAQALVLDAGGLERLPELPPLAGLAASLDESAGVRHARARLAVQAAQADLERSARVPDLTLTLGTRRAGETGGRQGVVGVALPLPLFDRNSARLGAALRRTDAAREELAAAQAAGGAELAAAHTRYALARADAETLRDEVLPQARSASALTLKGFEYGKFSILEVLDAQRTLFQSCARYWDALRAAWQAHAEIDRLAGAATLDDDRTTEPGTHP